MNFHVFRKVFLEFACFTSHQVYAWHPDFDKNNLSRWVKNGMLIKLRNGFYSFPEYLNQAGISLYLANRIYRPSYISLHSALSFYGFIPEAVIRITSVSSLKTAHFENPFGGFSYQTVKPVHLFGYDQKPYLNGLTLNIALPEKAMLDLLYLYPFYDSVKELQALRFDEELMQEMININTLKTFMSNFRSKALDSRVQLLIETYSL
jgi:predicted transcriptional regulator of viral defense system